MTRWMCLCVAMVAMIGCSDSAPDEAGDSRTESSPVAQETPSAAEIASNTKSNAEPPSADAPAERTVEAYDSETRGAIQVLGETTDWFRVLKDGKPVEYNPAGLNGTQEVEPGEYEVLVNQTKRTVNVEPGEKVVLKTGTLIVEADEGLYYTPYDGDKRLIAGNRNPPGLNSPIALFPGTYEVRLNVNLREVRLLGTAQVHAGETTTLEAEGGGQ